ncbi:unnamed protein product, partial [Meganyctiphanes norvegica]
GEKHYQNKTCDKSFSNKGNLISNMLLHTEEKTYQCDNHFPNISKIKTHLKTHTGDKSYQCKLKKTKGSKKKYIDNLSEHTFEVKEEHIDYDNNDTTNLFEPKLEVKEENIYGTKISLMI